MKYSQQYYQDNKDKLNARTRTIQKQYLAEGKCKCGQEKLPNLSLCKNCYKSRASYNKTLRDKRKAQGLCTACGVAKDSEKGCKCRETTRKYYYARRAKVLQAYGNQCKCCGESEEAFLALDHVNNDGNEHRKIVRGQAIYLWAINNDFPSTLQLLCHNCNFAKHSRGGCPHQK